MEVVMFIQGIRGIGADPDRLRESIQLWGHDIGPGAVGWLGSTGGITKDGTFVALMRFDAKQSMLRNRARSVQHNWFVRNLSALFPQEVEFDDSVEVWTTWGGGSDDAGFVRVVRGRVDDEQRLRDLDGELAALADGTRPGGVIGGVVALHGGGEFTRATYFASARAAGEDHGGAAYRRITAAQAALSVRSTTFDLHRPWFQSPGGVERGELVVRADLSESSAS
jgi:hypothetical protein